MKERIFKYLLEAGRGVTAPQILDDVFNIHSPDAHSSDNVLAGLLRQDPRFVLAEGLWHVLTASDEPTRFDLGQAVVLHLQPADRAGTFQGLRGALRGADGRIHEYVVPVSTNILGSLCSELEGHPLIVWSSRELGLWNRLLRSQRLEVWRGERLYLRNLAARILKRMPSKLQPENLASELGLSPADEERPRDMVRHLHACCQLLLDRVPAEFCPNLESLSQWIEGPRAAVDFSRFAFGPDFLRRLPSATGIYIMKDREGGVIYVGKSRNLKRRVSSYFNSSALNHSKIARIHAQLYSIDVRGTDNEIEALLMEMRMIAQFRPPVNLQAEIHERHADRHPERNLLIFVAGAKQKGARIYFLRNGILAGRHSASLGRPLSGGLQKKLKSLFFTQGKGRKRQGEIREKEIVSRWFKTNQQRLNYLDVDEAGDLTSLLERVSDYLHDPDRLTHKVYYR